MNTSSLIRLGEAKVLPMAYTRSTGSQRLDMLLQVSWPVTQSAVSFLPEMLHLLLFSVWCAY